MSFQTRKGKAPLHPLGWNWDNKAAAFRISSLWPQPRQGKSAFQMAYFKVHNTEGPCCYWFAPGWVTASLSTDLLIGTIHWASFKLKGEWMGHLSSGGAEEGVGWLLFELTWECPRGFRIETDDPYRTFLSFLNIPGDPLGKGGKSMLSASLKVTEFLSFHPCVAIALSQAVASSHWGGILHLPL